MLVVGPTILSNSRADAHLVVARLAESSGLKVIGTVRRSLADVRRTLPPPALGSGTALAHRMDSEVLVALRKE